MVDSILLKEAPRLLCKNYMSYIPYSDGEYALVQAIVFSDVSM